MKNVEHISRNFLPRELFEVIERFMFGEIASLQIVTMNQSREIEHFSFGETPRPLAEISSNQPCRVYEIKGAKHREK